MGDDRHWYRTCFETQDGVATGRIDLAENDATGTWTLRLRDAATGVTAEKTFLVKRGVLKLGIIRDIRDIILLT